LGLTLQQANLQWRLVGVGRRRSEIELVDGENTMLAFITGMPGYVELLIVAGLFLLLFGANRLPSMMRSMGRSVNEFKAGLSDKPGEKIDEPEENKPEKVNS